MGKTGSEDVRLRRGSTPALVPGSSSSSTVHDAEWLWASDSDESVAHAPTTPSANALSYLHFSGDLPYVASCDDMMRGEDEAEWVGAYAEDYTPTRPHSPTPLSAPSAPPATTTTTPPATPKTSTPPPTIPFTILLIATTLTTYSALHFLPFLRFLVIRLQRRFDPETALITTSLFSLSIGLLVSKNRLKTTHLLARLSPTKETTTVYKAIAISFVTAYHIAPRFFMALHAVCNHVPFFGAILVFLFLMSLLVAMFVLMLGAIGIYTMDVTSTLHHSLKRWFGFTPQPKPTSTRHQHHQNPSRSRTKAGSKPQSQSRRGSDVALYSRSSREGRSRGGGPEYANSNSYSAGGGGGRGGGGFVNSRRKDKGDEFAGVNVMDVPPSYVGF
ncbi:hypothetical protein HDU98_002067 [Podochytrium sp. JEL0797]|nr:hypothetical protein HDU98_002067 [Podochytrium sp. JEL0797]